jgi:hypothetical protein
MGNDRTSQVEGFARAVTDQNPTCVVTVQVLDELQEGRGQVSLLSKSTGKRQVRALYQTRNSQPKSKQRLRRPKNDALGTKERHQGRTILSRVISTIWEALKQNLLLKVTLLLTSWQKNKHPCC